MKVIKIVKLIVTFVLICALLMLSACNPTPPDTGNNGGSESNSGNGDGSLDDNDVDGIPTDDTVYDYTLVSGDNGEYVYECTVDGVVKQAKVKIEYVSGTENCYTVVDNTITFGSVAEDSEYAISGEFFGNVLIDVGDDYEFELALNGFSLTSYKECPIAAESGDKVTFSAKEGTQNYVFDMREEVSEEEHSASIFATCDIKVKGKGQLYVKSVNNNGIHSKDDLSLKNVTLQVECVDNALKGNDEVKIESGNYTLIATKGDGIKTSNSGLSKKDKQKGSVVITGGTLLIYAACDGIDAAYDVTVDESSADVDIQIFTDKYSKFSEEVTTVSEDKFYVRSTSATYKYSVYCFNDESDGMWVNSSSYTTSYGGGGRPGGMGGSATYYYEMAKPSNYSHMQLYVYSSSQQQGQNTNYVACSNSLTWNNSYDTISVTNRNGSWSFGWTNKTTSMGGPGGPGGFGGMDEGNTDKGDHSTKGIKADNAISISAGTIKIQAYDDGIHANNDVELESGATPSGNVTISGGTIQIASNDDGVHADGTLLVSGGTVAVTKSYEGLEGAFVEVSGGTVSVVSSDDGINGTATSGGAITVSGGNLYVYAGGDGLDSNSRTSNGGIVISGGTTVVISTSRADSAIDNEKGYAYSGGYVVAVGVSGGMSGESKNCPNFSSVGTSKYVNLSGGNYLTVTVASQTVAVVKIPQSINANVVYLGSNSATFSSKSTVSDSLNENGVYWNVQ